METQGQSASILVGVALKCSSMHGSMMLHGIYGSEEGKPVQGGETIVHGYLIIFDQWCATNTLVNVLCTPKCVWIAHIHADQSVCG